MLCIRLLLREIKQCQTAGERDNKENTWPRKEEVTGAKGNSYTTSILARCTRPYIIKVLKARRQSWCGNVACMGEITTYRNLLEKSK